MIVKLSPDPELAVPHRERNVRTVERRVFLIAAGTLLVLPLAAGAQPAAKVPTVGFLVAGTRASHGKWVAAFEQRLRELGWIDGRTVVVEYRWAEGSTERAGEFAADFVHRKVDVIVTSRTAVVAAVKKATSATQRPRVGPLCR